MSDEHVLRWIEEVAAAFKSRGYDTEVLALPADLDMARDYYNERVKARRACLQPHHSLCYGERCLGNVPDVDENGDESFELLPEVLCPCECHTATFDGCRDE